MKPGCLAVALVALLAPSALAAQPAGQPAQGEAKSDIVVTGHERKVEQEEKVTREARSVTRETDLRNEPLARFDDRACPGVVGLTQDFAEQIVGRFREVAEEYHIPLAPNGNCDPNIVIAVVEDGRAVLRQFQDKTRELSIELTPGERHELLDEPGPVKVYSVVQRRMQNGATMPKRQNLLDIPSATMEGGQSLISTATEQHIVKVVVLINRDAAVGKSLSQLSDYSIMRALAQTRDATGGDAPDSILSLFDTGGQAPPAGLTDFDRAYLTALYEGPPHVKGLSKLMRVNHHLEKIEAGKE
ncbi:MAG TPA: hypothetical protein VIC34_01900 [Croceibacterium sp.]|jgi:hypothetical protein